MQIVANLLNAMIVLDGCIFYKIQERKRKINFDVWTNAVELNSTKYCVQLKIENWCHLLTVMCPNVFHSGSMNERTFQCDGITFDGTDDGCGLVLIDVKVAVAYRWRKEGEKGEKLIHMPFERRTLFIVSLSSVVCQSYPSFRWSLEDSNRKQFILIWIERKENAVDWIMDWSMKVRRRHYISFSPIDSSLQF